MSESTPIFVGGAGRSGTTLVVDLLGLHPRISPVYETDFVIELIDLLFSDKPPPLDEVVDRARTCMDKWTRPLPLRPHYKREHERFHHGPHYILFDREFALARTAEFIQSVKQGRAAAGLRALMIALFREHCRLDGKVRWANKTPAYVNHMPILHRLFPRMRFIHCVRDGRDVVCSAMTRPWGPPTVQEAATWWAGKIRDGVEFGRQHPDRCLDVRYEDLLRQPEPTLQRIFEWLTEESCPTEIVRRYQEGGIRLATERIGEWQRKLSSTDLGVIDQHGGHWLAHFGYSRANP
jgi:hypothetical protein